MIEERLLIFLDVVAAINILLFMVYYSVCAYHNYKLLEEYHPITNGDWIAFNIMKKTVSNVWVVVSILSVIWLCT